MSARVHRRRLPPTVNLKSPLERKGGGESLRKWQVLSQVQGCSGHIAAVAALVNLVLAPDYCLSAVIRFSPSSESVDSGTEQVLFFFRKGSWSQPQCPRKLVECSVKPKTQAPEIQLTALRSLCAAAWGRPPAGTEAASSTAVVVIISVINKQALMGPSGGRGRLSLLRRRIPGMSQGSWGKRD